MTEPHRRDTHLPLIQALPRVAAAFCAVLSTLGIGICVYLTLIKFRMTYTPFATEHGGCGFGGMTCDDALNSAWSTVLTLPLSVWGAAFYLITLVLSCALAWRRQVFGGTAGHVLLVFALLDLLVSAVLGLYTLTALESPCPFCLTLYVLSVFLIGGAYLTGNPPGGGERTSWSDLVGRRLGATLDTVFVSGLVFIASTGTQSMIYHGMRNFVDSQMDTPSEDGLPPPGAKLGESDPAVIVALFLDMSCHKCRGEFKRLGSALLEGKFPAPTQLWIFHTPRQACDPTAFPSGYFAADTDVAFNNPCQAALAIECMDKLLTGGGANLTRGLFALHDDREESQPLFTAMRIGNRAVDLNLDIDPDDADNELFRCIDTDREVLSKITEHQRYAERNKLKVPTVAVYRALGGKIAPGSKAFYGDANTPIEAIFDFVSAQAGVDRPAPTP